MTLTFEFLFECIRLQIKSNSDYLMSFTIHKIQITMSQSLHGSECHHLYRKLIA